MTAREDYPAIHEIEGIGWAGPVREQASAALDEINRLRTALDELAREYDRLAFRAKAADVAVLEVPLLNAWAALCIRRLPE